MPATSLAHECTASAHTGHWRGLDNFILDESLGLDGLADRGVVVLVIEAERLQGELKVTNGDGIDNSMEVGDGEWTLEGYGLLLKARHHHGPVARGTELTLVSVKDDTLGGLSSFIITKSYSLFLDDNTNSFSAI